MEPARAHQQFESVDGVWHARSCLTHCLAHSAHKELCKVHSVQNGVLPGLWEPAQGRLQLIVACMVKAASFGPDTLTVGSSNQQLPAAFIMLYS